MEAGRRSPLGGAADEPTIPIVAQSLRKLSLNLASAKGVRQ